MRRMITTKQSEMLENIGEIVTPVARYPQLIEVVSDGIYWEGIDDQIDGNIDLENHTFSAGTSIEFDFASLKEKYGLDDGGAPAYVTFITSDNIDMPDWVVDFETLQQWMNTEDFADELSGVGVNIDEEQVSNDVAEYQIDLGEVAFDIQDNKLVLETVFEISEGFNELVVGASDPQYNSAKLENIEVENRVISDLTVNGSLNVLNAQSQFNSLPIFVDSLQNVIDIIDDVESFHVSISRVDYILTNDIKRYGAAGGKSILFFGQSTLTNDQITAINAAAPVELVLDGIVIGQNEGVYGITNTKIMLGTNEYIWNPDDEVYKIKGTFETISVNYRPVIITVDMPGGLIKAYNS